MKSTNVTGLVRNLTNAEAANYEQVRGHGFTTTEEQLAWQLCPTFYSKPDSLLTVAN
jgi:hypothetical protein